MAKPFNFLFSDINFLFLHKKKALHCNIQTSIISISWGPIHKISIISISTPQMLPSQTASLRDKLPQVTGTLPSPVIILYTLLFYKNI